MDKNEYHVYHLTKQSAAFTYTYADIIVISLIAFTLVFCVYSAFALLTFILKFVFGSLNLNKKVHSVLTFLLVGLSIGLAYASVKYTCSLPLAIIYGLLLIKLSLSSKTLSYRQFSNVTNIVFPLTLSLALQIDSYMLDAWRIHHTSDPLSTPMHY